MWAGFGTTFAYAHTGMDEYMHNGTTIAMSRMDNTEMLQTLDQCFESFRTSEEFYEVCAKKHQGKSQILSCIPNKHFEKNKEYQEKESNPKPYALVTNEHTSGCETGYCSCQK